MRMSCFRRGIRSFLIAAGVVVTASAQVARPAFEVASVKRPDPTQPPARPAPQPRRSTVFFRPGDTVSELIQRAYDVLAFQVVGGPDWIQKDRFQINARSSSEVSIEQMNVMLQSLLEDRFSLAVRRGEQNMRFQALTLARSDGRLGAGLRRCAEPDNAPPAKPVRIPRGGWASSRVCSPISTVAAIGTDLLGTPIIDRTGLAG